MRGNIVIVFIITNVLVNVNVMVITSHHVFSVIIIIILRVVVIITGQRMVGRRRITTVPHWGRWRRVDLKKFFVIVNIVSSVSMIFTRIRKTMCLVLNVFYGMSVKVINISLEIIFLCISNLVIFIKFLAIFMKVFRGFLCGLF